MAIEEQPGLMRRHGSRECLSLLDLGVAVALDMELTNLIKSVESIRKMSQMNVGAKEVDTPSRVLEHHLHGNAIRKRNDKKDGNDEQGAKAFSRRRQSPPWRKSRARHTTESAETRSYTFKCIGREYISARRAHLLALTDDGKRL